MDIDIRTTENTPAPAAPATPATPAKSGAKPAAGQDEGAQVSPFMALLAALDPAQASPSEVAFAAPQDAETLPTAQEDASDLLLQTDAMALVGLPQSVVLSQAELAVGHGRRAPVAGAGSEGGALQSSVDALRAGSQDTLGAWAQDGTNGGRGGMGKPRTAMALLQQQAQAAQARASDARTDDLRGQLERGARADALAMDGGKFLATSPAQAAATTAAANATTAAEVLAGFARSQLVQRSTERHSAKGAQSEPTVAFAGMGADTLVQGNGAAMGPTTVSAMVAAGPSAGAALAEKLSFWMGRGVQTAELQLEAFDGATVDVRIALQGQDAQVEFRSDMPEARRWLQDAMPQLKDLLQGEGLRLSGGFVGTPDQGRDGVQPRPGGSSGARIATVRAEAAQAAGPRSIEASGMPGRSMGRSVDLFV